MQNTEEGWKLAFKQKSLNKPSAHGRLLEAYIFCKASEVEVVLKNKAREASGTGAKVVTRLIWTGYLEFWNLFLSPGF